MTTEAIVSNVVVILLKCMGQSVVKEIAPYLGGISKVNELQDTMRMIQARLFDAERMQEGDHGALVKEWLIRLKHVLYRLEDIFEEVALVEEERKEIPGGMLTKQFRIFISRSSPFKVNKQLAHETKAIVNEFNSITSDMLSLNLRACSSVVEQQAVSLSMTNSRETYSSIFEEDEVIGREEDKEAIMKTVLFSGNEGGNVAVIPIIGIGGLGKTTLAQLVYNDEDVKKKFEPKGWACISEISSLEELARRVLRSFTTSSSDFLDFGMEELKIKLQEVVNDKKYLLVLDDIWDESRERWLHLKHMLSGGKRGSKIIITSRSRVVAVNMSTIEPYELKGLSEDKSWELFRILAFKEGQEEMHPNMANIGREIIKKCANVPLAIRATAGVLYSKDTEIEWESFKNGDMRVIEQSEDKVMETLKLSYDHLQPVLKQCFTYCSLFPKDYEWMKQDLIYLWMAQGYIRPSNEATQGSWEVGHGYFMELLRRSFFQDVERDESGEIMSCKMHDLMHDLAGFVAGGETFLLKGSSTEHIIKDNNIFHLSCIVGSSWEAPSWLLASKQIRSFILLSSTNIINISEIFSCLRFIRALDLAKVEFDVLPESAGELKHLRYLKLSYSTISLPKCITKLKKLQTLDLRPCFKLQELPKSFIKLNNLRHLHILCRLIDMPTSFGKLASLQTLDVFIVGKSNGLDALASLTNLTGRLAIHFKNRRENYIQEAMTANLDEKRLTSLVLEWSSSYGEPVTPADNEKDELSLKFALPHSLKNLQVERWRGVKFPSWGMDVFPCLLPNLVCVRINYCKKCKQLPPFCRLPLLKSLELRGLEEVEYIEISSNDYKASPTTYFRSLESLVLNGMHKLKRWFREVIDFPQPSFPLLTCLKITNCFKLISMPLVPKIVSLNAQKIHEKLLRNLLCRKESPSSPSSFSSATLSSLREIRIESINKLASFSTNHLSSLESLRIENCQELISCTADTLCSLRRLEVVDCGNLRNISEALQHLSVIEKIKFWDCKNFDLLNTNADVKPAWQGLKSLRSLVLGKSSSLESLPRGLRCVTNLQELYIYRLDNLRALPEWIDNLTHLRQLYIQDCHNLIALPKSLSKLTSLQRLSIRDCSSELRKRCQRPDGEYWPLIQHVSDFYLG